MQSLIYTSEYGFAIFFGISLFVFDTFFEGGEILTALYRGNLRADFTRARYFWARGRFFVIAVLCSFVAQVIAKANPEAYTMTPPDNGLTLYQILLIAVAIASLGGCLFSIVGWGKFTVPNVENKQ